MRNTRRSYLKRLAAQLLKEDADALKKNNDSLDAQVDKLLTDYESDSNLSETFLREEDEKDDSKKLSGETIDVENFVGNVVRLIENYDNLLDIKNVILRRSFNFLLKNYDPSVATQAENVLSRRGLIAGETKSEINNDRTQPPAADRAGPGGLG